MHHRVLRWLPAVAFAVLLSGCSTFVNSALDTAARRAGQAVGESAGNAAGARLAEAWSPYMTRFYVRYLFGMAFHPGFRSLDSQRYAPGEWTRWRIHGTTDDGEVGTLERAFLGRTDEGAEWWRVKHVVHSGEASDTIVLEGLFSREGGELRRLRGKMPGDAEARELPVQENTYRDLARPGLTEESIEGATVGTTSVTVPAGTFEARHIRYGQPGGGTVELWLSDTVPGELVKYRASRAGARAGDGDRPDPNNWVLELVDHGSGAVSELGVM